MIYFSLFQDKSQFDFNKNGKKLCPISTQPFCNKYPTVNPWDICFKLTIFIVTMQFYVINIFTVRARFLARYKIQKRFRFGCILF